jgi:hypothetical protein
MHDAADDTAIIITLGPCEILRQMRLDPAPLRIAEPEQTLPHDHSRNATMGIRIMLRELGTGPSLARQS